MPVGSSRMEQVVPYLRENAEPQPRAVTVGFSEGRERDIEAMKASLVGELSANGQKPTDDVG